MAATSAARRRNLRLSELRDIAVGIVRFAGTTKACYADASILRVPNSAEVCSP
jgi:hypothetical protein